MSSELSRRLRRSLSCGVLAATVLLSACGTDSASNASDETSITEAATRADQQGLSITVPGTLAAEFAELQSGARGKVGMAIMPVGGDRMAIFGNWTSGAAWSTMKVPLAIAALRRSPRSNSYAASVAITASDNAAADVLWQSLGSSQQAAQAVEAVLREAGDTKTAVPATRARPEYSAFGQVEWGLSEQVRFASRLPCLPQTADVIDLMGQIDQGQRWGLSEFAGAVFKGGWGPDLSGSYLVRQFGLIPLPSGQIAIAFAAQPNSGGLTDGMNTLDKMATLVSQHLDELSGGGCRS